MEYIVGVDIGGTFTDSVVLDEIGQITIGKALSTPTDFSVGATNAVKSAAEKLGLGDENGLLDQTRVFFHACTIGENTLITRSGATTGLIATSGFGDAILMMRGKTTEGLGEAEAAHLSALGKPEPFVPKDLIGEVSERIDCNGTVLCQLTEAEAEKVIADLAKKGVESIAVALLWSIANDTHEIVLAKLIKEKYPEMFLTLSTEVAPFLGEYERTATTIFNAYIGPKITAYLRNLDGVLKTRGLRSEPLIMQAYGGVLGIEATCKNAVGTIESGPASGVVGTRFFGDLIGERNILATDMGGTTFKVSVIRDAVIERDYKPVFLRHSILSPKIWVESIGAGGGSVAWIDPETHLLKVGPQGAGAKPGPVCYGLGGMEPTVSDADLALGYLNDKYFLGGKMSLDRAAALAAISEKIAKPLGLSDIEAASGIYRIANSHMSDLIRKATVEKGHDPRAFTLFAYGGAGPVHASRYAADLGIKEVVIPLTASVHGATGLISSDVVYEHGKSDPIVVPAEVRRVNANFSELVDKAYRDLASTGFDKKDVEISRSVDMRYRYQVHELNVPLPIGDAEINEVDLEELYSRFDEFYERSYGKGSGYREAGKELITFRTTARGRMARPRIKTEPLQKHLQDGAVKEQRDVYFEEYRDFVATKIFDFEELKPGVEVAGPAVIETPVTTIVVNPKDRAGIDEFHNVRIAVGV
jgi:N-methylhydantoinase A